jgi:phospholipid/cholesterol/gamma-HCH transport system substrate-binding protein
VLLALNPRSETVRADWRSFKGFSDAYAAAADDIVATLDAASTTSTTVTDNAAALDALLLNTIGFGRAGVNLLAPNQKNLIDAINTLEPTTALLLKYNPEYTCLLVGAKWWLDNGGIQAAGGNGRTSILDGGIMWGSDPYKYPVNLPTVAAKGGPGGKPSCGSLPDASKNFPVRALVTNTGWGTGLDYRPNPGIGNPCWANYFPVTRAVPEPPSIRQCLPGPAIGPVPYPGAPPYGAPLYGPGGVPLWPGVPPPPQPPAPESAPPPAPAAEDPAQPAP